MTYIYESLLWSAGNAYSSAFSCVLESGKRLINRYFNGLISPESSFAVNRQGHFISLLERINDRSNHPSPQQQYVIFRLLFEYERNKDYQEIPEQRRSVDFGRCQFQHSLLYALFGHVTF